MPRNPVPHAVTVRGIDLNIRELDALRFIYRRSIRGPVQLRRPPTQPELYEHLNEKGHKLSSFQQTQRIVESLREKGLLYSSAELRNKAYNMALTDKAVLVLEDLRK